MRTRISVAPPAGSCRAVVVAWPDGFFADIVGRFLGTEHARTGRIGDADSHLLDAAGLVEFAVPLMVDAAEEFQATNTAR